MGLGFRGLGFRVQGIFPVVRPQTGRCSCSFRVLRVQAESWCLGGILRALSLNISEPCSCANLEGRDFIRSFVEVDLSIASLRQPHRSHISHPLPELTGSNSDVHSAKEVLCDV